LVFHPGSGYIGKDRILFASDKLHSHSGLLFLIIQIFFVSIQADVIATKAASLEVTPRCLFLLTFLVPNSIAFHQTKSGFSEWNNLEIPSSLFLLVPLSLCG